MADMQVFRRPTPKSCKAMVTRLSRSPDPRRPRALSYWASFASERAVAAYEIFLLFFFEIRSIRSP
uniref:Uncharacterized protein n=1 Tax=Utricularia reniformis TaxID=192314 RepID=A0A1Y0B4R1_9LAMI|nr:hypothetical protein AEK19_MT2171 [Utricularia reniformis]ART32319.1 hypothetical protein AEK19_MT2171 [Utricularia reniformis]